VLLAEGRQIVDRRGEVIALMKVQLNTAFCQRLLQQTQVLMDKSRLFGGHAVLLPLAGRGDEQRQHLGLTVAAGRGQCAVIIHAQIVTQPD